IFFFQAEDGIRDRNVTGVQTCALPISLSLVALPIELDLHCLDYSIKNNRCSSYLTQKILCAPRSLLYYLMKQYILFLLQSGGGCRVRTCDPLLVRQVLSQLS